MHYRPGIDPHGLKYSPLKALVFPRPIGWISTLSKEGQANLAPYSFFNLISEQPPLLAFNSFGAKDSASNAEQTGEFVHNLCTYAQKEAMNASAKAVASSCDEFELAGLEKIPSVMLKAPAVKQAPARLECRVEKIIDLPCDADQRSMLVIGRIVCVHIDDAYIKQDLIDQQALDLIARCGYHSYARTSDFFSLPRP